MIQILPGDALEVLQTLPAESVHCCVTSPPYWGLRDYGIDAQLGLERTPDEYVARLVAVFREVRRVLRSDGTLWLNLGDSYTSGGRKERDPGQSKIHPAYEGESFQDGLRPDTPPGLKPKDLCGIPWRVAFALQADGWWLRQDLIWAKPNPMPESVTDRCTKAHEYIFLLSKSARYFYNAEAINEETNSDNPISCSEYRAEINRGGNNRGVNNFDINTTKKPMGNRPDGKKNRRSVWTVATQPYPEAHFATFPEELPRLCILAGCPPSGTVLDPFCGSGTTGLVARKLGNAFIGIELNPEYIQLAQRRIHSVPKNLFAEVMP